MILFSDTEDNKLIQQYLKGDEKSLEILVARYLKPIYNFVYKNVGDQASAEDITQEVFVKVWKNLKKFDSKKSFKPWIFQIAKNTSIDFLRKKKSLPFSIFENEQGQNALIENTSAPESDLIGGLSDKKEVEELIINLSEEDKEIIKLRHTSGMNFKEIAERIKEPINTVKSRYRRIILKLRNKV